MEKRAIQIKEMHHPGKRSPGAIARLRNRHGVRSRGSHRHTEPISRSRMRTLDRSNRIAAQVEQANDPRVRHRGVVVGSADEDRVADHFDGKSEQSGILLLWRTKGGKQIGLEIEKIHFPCRERSIVVSVVRDQDLVAPDGVQRDSKVVASGLNGISKGLHQIALQIEEIHRRRVHPATNQDVAHADGGDRRTKLS